MKLWTKENPTTWVNTSGKYLSYDPVAKLLCTESGHEAVVIPLTVVRSLLEDNGYEVHSTDTMEKSRQIVDRFLAANQELQFEKWEREEDLKEALAEKAKDNRATSSNLRSLESEVNFVTDLLMNKADEIVFLRRQLMDLKASSRQFKESVLSFAQELITKSAVIASDVIGQYMLKRFGDVK